ncbi:SpoIVB peptidase [Jeotgalibacillus soli]|uniref:SpoIVB peptidase n=1 Tax=Jeotgalibacillus soli TaxID=889306 RepID=A0A0C2V5S8_9BACL|nr:SpoIVB peptidase [Jeotgalibacillus soli]KIL44347.1 hypothetical protein KP78_33110 [Jeotgalibacillus soli]
MRWRKIWLIAIVFNVLLLFPSMDQTIHASSIKLFPGGQSVGISLETKGVMVVGFHATDQDSMDRAPAALAGLKIGDTLTRINGISVSSAADLSQVLKTEFREKSSVQLEVTRESKQMNVEVTPTVNKQGHPQLGLYVRNHTQGIGTVSYIDPNTGAFGALGHVVTDADTGKVVDMRIGTVQETQIDDIQKGIAGKPGGKIAVFTKNGLTLGIVKRNTPYGIFGTLNKIPPHSLFKEPLPVASHGEIREGKAEMLTVIHDNTIERFVIEIVRTKTEAPGGTVGMLIRITDPALIEKTGGIIQGMSGSPIVQNGKLIGAVTHVLVHDPTSGYALPIEEMIKQSGQKEIGKEQAA